MTDRLDEAKRLHAAALEAADGHMDHHAKTFVMDGYKQPVALYFDAAIGLAPDLFALAEAAEKRLEGGHGDHCDTLNWFKEAEGVDKCTCGYEDLRAAVDRVRGRKS